MPDLGAADVADALTHLARHDAGRVIAILTKKFGDIEIADEAVQEALISAHEVWPERGVPDNPAAWLNRVAQRKAIDRIRKDDSARRRLLDNAPELASEIEQPAATKAMEATVTEEGFDPGDERLRLILLCCHPALSEDARVALTLRMVAGLTTEEIAAAFLVPTPTLAQRISRAKKKIRVAKIPMSLPQTLDDRLAEVLQVLYLVFNEGYLSRSGTEGPNRVDMCEEAIRLADLVCVHTPEHGEPAGLLALMIFNHARRDARFAGEQLVLLEEQDRSRWQLDEVKAANQILVAATQKQRPGPFQLQAMIAAVHCNATDAADTDWAWIVSLYTSLLEMTASPVIALNRCVAVAMADGPLAGLKELDGIAGLDDYYLFHATKGELLTRSDQQSEAVESFETALKLTENPSEQRHLRERLEAIG